MTRVTGIDPGQTGACCVLDDSAAHKRRIRDDVEREVVARMSHQAGRAVRIPIYAADAAAIALWAFREAKLLARSA